MPLCSIPGLLAMAGSEPDRVVDLKTFCTTFCVVLARLVVALPYKSLDDTQQGGLVWILSIAMSNVVLIQLAHGLIPVAFDPRMARLRDLTGHNGPYRRETRQFWKKRCGLLHFGAPGASAPMSLSRLLDRTLGQRQPSHLDVSALKDWLEGHLVFDIRAEGVLYSHHSWLETVIRITSWGQRVSLRLTKSS